MNLIICIIIFGLFRGIDEGMTMIMSGDIMHTGLLDGIRGHAWFDWYHAISAVPYLALFVIAWIVFKSRWRWLYYIGLLVLMWEFTEIGENIARYHIFWPPHEYVNFFEILKINIDGLGFWVLHAARLIISIPLLIIYRE